MDRLFSQSSPGADPIYSTKYVAGRATGQRRRGIMARQPAISTEICHRYRVCTALSDIQVYKEAVNILYGSQISDSARRIII